MKRTVEGNLLAYTAADETVYIVTPLNPVAGLLGISQIPETPIADINHIFEDSGVQKLILMLPEEAADEKRIARGAGFKQEGRLKKATPTGDMLIFGQYR